MIDRVNCRKQHRRESREETSRYYTQQTNKRMSNTNNTTTGDDAEAMRQSFESFMLSGKQSANESEKTDDASSLATQSNKSRKKKKKKKSKSIGGAATTPLPKLPSTPSIKSSGGSSIGTPSTSSSTTKQKSKEKKRYYQLINSFNDKVTHTWINIDDQILTVLQNVVSIRSRLPLEWKVLHSSHLKDDNVNPQDDDYGRKEDDWKQHGLQGKLKETPYSFHLHTSDVQLALNHDMTQHEKILAAIRTLMTNLSDCHEALSRVVDTLWKFHLDCTQDRIEEDDDEDKEDGEIQDMVDNVTEVYQMLSSELYRKQLLIPLILESTQDEILGIEKGKIIEGSRKGLQSARECCKSWDRNSEESCIDESKLSYVLKLGKLESTAQ